MYDLLNTKKMLKDPTVTFTKFILLPEFYDWLVTMIGKKFFIVVNYAIQNRRY